MTRCPSPAHRGSSAQPRLGRRSYLAFSLIALLGGSGCASVAPWERGEFTTYAMRPDRDPLHTAMAEHIYFSREASSGGRGVGGSGCGCN